MPSGAPEAGSAAGGPASGGSASAGAAAAPVGPSSTSTAPPVAAVGGSTGDPGAAGSGGGPSAGTAGAMSGGAPFYAGSDPARNNVLPGGLCARIATIQCAAQAHCCFAPARDVEACEAELRNSCAQELFLDEIAANPITGFDADATAAILTEFEERSARCDIEIGAWGVSSAGLRGMLKGTLAPNASCKPAGVSAVTEKAAQAAALASCADIDQYACLPMSILGDWTCAAKSGNGGSCITDDNCQPDMYCSNPSMAPLGKCAQRLALGASCANGNECSSLYCKAGQCVAAEQQVVFCLD